MPLDIGGGWTGLRWGVEASTWKADGEDIDLKLAIFDLENIQTGWLALGRGQDAQSVWDGDTKAPRPHSDADWKRGFALDVVAPKTFGDDEPRALVTNGVGVCKGIQALYVQFEAQREGQNGKVPLCAFSGGDKIKIGQNGTSVPQLSISKWIERPDALKNSAAAPAEAVVEEEDDAEF